jgi:hypothetical protein
MEFQIIRLHTYIYLYVARPVQALSHLESSESLADLTHSTFVLGFIAMIGPPRPAPLSHTEGSQDSGAVGGAYIQHTYIHTYIHT